MYAKVNMFLKCYLEGVAYKEGASVMASILCDSKKSHKLILLPIFAESEKKNSTERNMLI